MEETYHGFSLLGDKLSSSKGNNRQMAHSKVSASYPGSNGECSSALVFRFKNAKHLIKLGQNISKNVERWPRRTSNSTTV